MVDITQEMSMLTQRVFWRLNSNTYAPSVSVLKTFVIYNMNKGV